MEGLLTCLQRMVLDVKIRSTINSKIEMYQDSTGLFGFDDVVRERTTLMPCKSLEFRTLDFLNSIMCFTRKFKFVFFNFYFPL
jgi:hypothetical protein